MIMVGFRELVARQGPLKGPPRSPEYMTWNVGPKLIAIDCTLYGIAMLTMVLRVYVRIFMLKMFGVDDYLMLMATALSTTCIVLFIRCISFGMGHHYDAIPVENMAPLFKALYFYAIFIIFAYSFIKLSIGVFLLRLADRTRWRRFLQVTIGFLVIFTLGSTLAIIFQCIPVKAGYDMSLRPPTGTAKCYPADLFKNIGVFNSSINIATDLLFALLPIPIVWKLQVNIRTKVGLVFIMGLGLFASATAIYKTPMQYNFFKEPDWSGKGSWYYIWQQVEMNIGITAANLPTLKPLLANFFDSVRSLTTGGTTKNSSARSGISTPFKASGYLKQNESEGLASPGAVSFAMSNLSKGTEKTYGGDTSWYHTTGKRGSRSGDSDESILREHGGSGGRDMSRGMIIKTTEVDMS